MSYARFLAIIVLALGAHFAPAQPAPKADEAVKEDLAQVQGRWQRIVTDADGKVLRWVKEHKGNKTVHTVFDAQGAIVGGRTSEFKLERREGVRLFTFTSNQWKTKASFLYKVEGDVFVEVNGLLVGDETPASVVQWKRAK